jgi:hypothetical protein
MRLSPQIATRLVGIISILTAIGGAWYTIEIIRLAVLRLTPTAEAPYVVPISYVMAFICILCYLGLFYIGLQFICLKMRLYRIFIGITIFETLYFCSIGALWLSVTLIPSVGTSIAGASGINGGLIIQFIILFPLWSPFVVMWAHKRMTNLHEIETS